MLIGFPLWVIKCIIRMIDTKNVVFTIIKNVYNYFTVRESVPVQCGK